MSLPELDEIVTWVNVPYKVVAIFTEPALIIEDVRSGQRFTVGASTVKRTA